MSRNPVVRGSLGRAVRIFNEAADELISEWLARKQQPAARRAESANAWFKKEAYRLLGSYIEQDRLDVFQSATKGRSRRLISDVETNPFKFGLLAMFSDESLSRSDRHVFGNQMLHAWKHYVPADFLNAFLAVTGGPAQVAKKLKENQIEPGFEERVRRFKRPDFAMQE